MQIELIKSFWIEAAHYTGRGGERGARLHGHSLRVDVVCSGRTKAPLDWLIDYGEISHAFQPVHDALDHRDLNEALHKEDISLVMVRDWIEEQLSAQLDCLQAVHVAICGDGAFVPRRREADAVLDFPDRLAFTLEAAHFLPHVPESHKCRRMHGHSFRIEAAAADLEELEEHLLQVYDELDHTCLNDHPGLENATSEVLSRWLWQRLDKHVTNLQVIIVQETCTARCVYRGDD